LERRKSLKILSWNIEHGGYRSYDDRSPKPMKMEMIIEAVRQVNADVVSLVDVFRWSEVYSSQELGDKFGFENVYMTDFEDKGSKHKNGQLGLVVMTNLTVNRFEKFRAYDRNFIKTSVTVGDKKLDVFSIHLNHASEEKRAKETQKILDLVKINSPTIITGDFNTIDKDDLVDTRKMTDHPIIKVGSIIKKSRPIIVGMYPATITQKFVEARLTDFGKDRGNTFPTFRVPLVLKRPAARLDYAFGSKEVKLLSFKVLRDKKFEKLSDHYPILVEINL